MSDSIITSVAGFGKALLALPVPKGEGTFGGSRWITDEAEGIKKSLVGRFSITDKKLRAFDAIEVYGLELAGRDAVQTYWLSQPYLPVIAVEGKASLLAGQNNPNTTVSAVAPVGGVKGLPLLMAVYDLSGSTGHHWSQGLASRGVQIEEHIFEVPHDNPRVGVPRILVYELTAKEPGAHVAQFVLTPPASPLPVSTVTVSLLATAAAE